jgi:excisionase family DNA binding protein
MAPTGFYERTQRDDEAVFWTRVDKHTGPTPDPKVYGDIGRCWLWLGSRSRTGGYGTFSVMKKNRMAHVAAYILTHGHEPPPETPLVLHLCDNGNLGCVRPSHLEAGTRRDNTRGMYARGRWQPLPKAPRETGDEGPLTTSEAAEALGVSPPRIRQLILEGRLPATRRGRDLLIERADLRAVAVRKVGRPPKKG